jgi:acyl-CoA synthetase (AMP-forming)/AMP-acid ligase II
MRVQDLLFDSAAATPEAPLLVTATQRHSYAEIAAMTDAAARGLAASGVRRGDRVVIALDNSAEFVAAYLGAMAAGAVAVPMPGGPKSDRLPKAVLDCAPAAIVSDDVTLETLPAAVLTTVPTVITTAQVGGERAQPFADLLARGRSWSAPLSSGIDLDLAAIIYTSGSTGEPRGAMLSHLNILSNTRSIVEYLKLTASDRMLVVLPFHYVYGLSLLHTHVAVGGSLVLENRFAFPNLAVKAIAAHEATGFAGVPSTFAILLHRTNLASRPLPSLRYVTQAGGAMSPAHIREWREALPRVAFYVMYGATEASARLAYLPPSELERKLGSIGHAIPNVELAIEREDGTLAGAGEVGELVARGANIMAGYWNRPVETAQALGPNGYRTGDLARRDEEGYFYIVGRKTDMLKVGAHRVGAREIEDVLNEHPDVHESAVVGEADELMGEVPVACVVGRQAGGADEAALRAFCRDRLPEHKVPVRVVFLDELPKNDNAKVNKQALRAWLSSRATAAGGVA